MFLNKLPYLGLGCQIPENDRAFCNSSNTLILNHIYEDIASLLPLLTRVWVAITAPTARGTPSKVSISKQLGKYAVKPKPVHVKYLHLYQKLSLLQDCNTATSSGVSFNLCKIGQK